MRALKMRSIVASHRKLTMTNWEPSSKPILLQLREKFPKNSMSTIPQSPGIHLKQSGKVKKLDKWVLHELTANQKMVILKYHLLSFYTTMSHFSTGTGCMVKRQPAMTSSVAEPRSSKALPKAKLAPKKGHGYCLMVFCQCVPLQLSQPQWDHRVCWEVCSANWWDALQTAVAAAVALVTRKGPALSVTMPTTWHTAMLRKWRNWVMKFCLSCHIHQASRQPTTTSSSISVACCRENTSATSRKQDMFSKSLSNPETQIFFFCLSWS